MTPPVTPGPEVAADPANAYQALSETVADDDPRWAFGTGVEDVQAEITAPVPDGVDPADLVAYCLMLGDDALVCSHRISEWVSHAPELEEEVALANIALDLLGQARVLLARAGRVEGRGRDEDDLAYRRDPAEFRNVALAELDDGRDFGRAVARLLVFAVWRLALLERLVDSRDPVIAAVAAKGVKEVAYHREYAAGWAVRLGDGTEHSRDRFAAGLRAVWPHVAELFGVGAVERAVAAAGVGVDPGSVRASVDAVLDRVLAAATVPRPEVRPAGRLGGRSGRDGVHTEQLGQLLTVLQGLARQHPGARW